MLNSSHDWMNGIKLTLPSMRFLNHCDDIKANLIRSDGYQRGFLERSYHMMDFFNNNISYEKLLIVTSTRVYGLGNGREITEDSQTFA